MRKDLTKIALVAVLGIAGAGFVGADQWDKKTTITIDEAVQLPNTTLQPGSYVIRLADSLSYRHVVQIFDKDEKHVITTILAIPNERLQPTGKSVFAFWETPAGQPKALRAWFYPGDNFGQEFAYPKAEADRIALNNNGAKVPESDENAAEPPAPNSSSTTTVETAQVPTPAPAEPAPAPVEVATTAQETAPLPAAEPSEPVNQAPIAAGPERDARRVAETPAPQELPQTASNLPLFGLVGLLSIAGALLLNLRLRRN